MYNLLMMLMLIVSVILIIVVVLQPTKTNSSSTAFMGGAGSKELFSIYRPRGFERFLYNLTIFFGVAFFVIALLIQVIH